MLKCDPTIINNDELYQYIYDIMGERPIRTKEYISEIGGDEDIYYYMQFSTYTVVIRYLYTPTITKLLNKYCDFDAKYTSHYESGCDEIETPNSCNECGTIHNIKPIYAFECEDWDNTIYICESCFR